MKEISIKYKVHKTFLYYGILKPIFLIFDLLKFLHKSLIKNLWMELIQGQRQPNIFVTLGGAFFFFIGSLYVYKYDNYLDFIILCLVVASSVDFILMRIVHPLYLKEHEFSLKCVNGEWFYKKGGSKREHIFNPNEMKRLIIREDISQKGIIFEEDIAVWRLFMVSDFQNESILIFESENPIETFDMAEEMSRELSLVCPQIDEIKHNNTQGLGLGDSFSKSLIFNQKNQSFSLKQKINFASFLDITKAVFEKSGLLLFIVIVESFTVRLGEVLSYYYGPYLGVEKPYDLVIRFNSILSGLNVFMPNFKTGDYVSMALVSVTLISVIFLKLKSQSITFDQGHLIIKKGNKELSGQLNHIDFKYLANDKVDVFFSKGEESIFLHDFCNHRDLRKLRKLLSTDGKINSTLC